MYLWDQHLGAVALDPRYGYYAFAYTPEARRAGLQPAPLTMPTTEERAWIFTELPEATYKRLPALMADALPDDFGNALIDRYMAERGLSAQQVTPLDRLAYMAGRGLGALTFRPARGPANRLATAIELGQLVEAARRAVSGSLEDEEQAGASLRGIIDVGTSAGGARAKAVVAWNPVTHELRSGQVEAPAGFEHWLLKFDGVGPDHALGASQPFGRVEYAYHLMARAAGVHMEDCRLLEEHGRAHFMTRRFDREPAGEGPAVRHHTQTLCAMAHLDYKKRGTHAYAQLFHTVQALGLPYEAREEAFRRMALNVMGRNCDDHTKNLSFRLRQGHPWELAPAYDISFAHNPQGEWTRQHLMAVDGRYDGITAENLLAEADRFALGTGRRVLEQVRAAILDWPRFAQLAGVPEPVTTAIRSQQRPLPA